LNKIVGIDAENAADPGATHRWQAHTLSAGAPREGVAREGNEKENRGK